MIKAHIKTQKPRQNMGLALTRDRTRLDLIVADVINAAGNAIASVRLSVCPSVRLSVRLLPLYLRNRLTVDLKPLHVSRSWPWLAEDWKSRSRSWARLMRSVRPRSREVCFSSLPGNRVSTLVWTSLASVILWQVSDDYAGWWMSPRFVWLLTVSTVLAFMYIILQQCCLVVRVTYVCT